MNFFKTQDPLSRCGNKTSPASLVELRSLQADDIKYLIYVLRPTLDYLYPKGALLFRRRLDQVLSGQASASVVCIQQHIVGVAAQVPKESGRLKVSTFWIDPRVRRRLLGFRLGGMLVQRWIQAEVNSVHVTVAHDRLAPLHSLLGRFGFRWVALEKNRYGSGRDEAILRWTPEWAASVGIQSVSRTALKRSVA